MHEAQVSGGLGQHCQTALLLLSAVLVPRPWKVLLAALVLREQTVDLGYCGPFPVAHVTTHPPSPVKVHWAVLTSFLHLPVLRGSKFISAEEP